MAMQYVPKLERESHIRHPWTTCLRLRGWKRKSEWCPSSSKILGLIGGVLIAWKQLAFRLSHGARNIRRSVWDYVAPPLPFLWSPQLIMSTHKVVVTRDIGTKAFGILKAQPYEVSPLGVRSISELLCTELLGSPDCFLAWGRNSASQVGAWTCSRSLSSSSDGYG